MLLQLPAVVNADNAASAALQAVAVAIRWCECSYPLV